MKRLCFLCGRVIPKGSAYCEACAKKQRKKIPEHAFSNLVGNYRKKFGLSFGSAVKNAKKEFRRQKREFLRDLKSGLKGE